MSADRVEVCTIHSFLFSNVVKPYLHLLRRPDGRQLVNTRILEGHLEHRPSFKRVDEWLKSVSKMQLSRFNWPEVIFFLQKLSWKLTEATHQWQLRPNRAKPPGKYFPIAKLDNYKDFYWVDGIVDHDDILYLSYQILRSYPLIRRFLARRFPYLLVDEFQDTSPAQAVIVKWMAEEGTVVTVVGDEEQAIYGFQGASVDAFLKFELPNQEKLTISGNRRSTRIIVDFLNLFRRDDLKQHTLRQVDGDPVQIVVGQFDAVICAVTSTIGRSNSPQSLAVLARSNSEVTRLRSDPAFDVGKYWADLIAADHERARFLHSCCEAATHIAEGQISTALTELRSAIRIADGKLGEPFRFAGEVGQKDREAIAVSIGKFLSHANREMQSASLLDVYNGISQALQQGECDLALSRTKGGKFAQAAQRAHFGALVYNQSPSSSIITSTIHKAKGAQFKNVLVFFSDSFSLDSAIHASRTSEERRVAYVALSRAEDRLFIGTPSLSHKQEESFQEKGCIVKRIT